MMNLGLRKRLGLRPSLASLDPSASGAGGGVRPPYPAPSGYRWVFLTDTGSRLADTGQTLITLERIA